MNSHYKKGLLLKHWATGFVSLKAEGDLSLVLMNEKPNPRDKEQLIPQALGKHLEESHLYNKKEG